MSAETPHTTDHPYDAVDLLFLLLSAIVPQLAPLALLQYAARRSRVVVRGLLHLAAQTRGELQPQQLAARPVVRTLLPGATLLLAGPASAAAATTLPLTLDEVADADNLLIVGPKGSGKTTLLRELLARRSGDHCALDPHNQPGSWPCSVIGGGLDFGAIHIYLHAVQSRLKGRYQAMNRGVAEHPRLTIVADEWRAIAHELPDMRRDGQLQPGAARIMRNVITQGRKVRLCFIGAAHADTVEALGIAGEGDLRSCFDWVIYLGALAVRKLPEARSQARPAVAYHVERDTVYLLDLPATISRTVPRSSPTDDRDALLAALLSDVRDVRDAANPTNGQTPHTNAVRQETSVRERACEPTNLAAASVANAADANAMHEPPTPDELRQLMRAVTLRAQGRSKQESIETAFAVRKGGAARWQRAYALFAAATSEPGVAERDQ